MRLHILTKTSVFNWEDVSLRLLGRKLKYFWKYSNIFFHNTSNILQRSCRMSLNWQISWSASLKCKFSMLSKYLNLSFVVAALFVTKLILVKREYLQLLFLSKHTIMGCKTENILTRTKNLKSTTLWRQRKLFETENICVQSQICKYLWNNTLACVGYF